MPVAGAVLITSAPRYDPSLLVNFDPNVPLARAPGFSRLGFKYWIWTQFWRDVEVAHSLADWDLNVCLPNNRVRVWPAPYTFDSWLPGLAARTPVTGNADRSRKDGSGQRVHLLWFPVTPIQHSWGLWPFTEGWEAARFDIFFSSFFFFQFFFLFFFSFFFLLPVSFCSFFLCFLKFLILFISLSLSTCTFLASRPTHEYIQSSGLRD